MTLSPLFFIIAPVVISNCSCIRTSYSETSSRLPSFIRSSSHPWNSGIIVSTMTLFALENSRHKRCTRHLPVAPDFTTAGFLSCCFDDAPILLHPGVRHNGCFTNGLPTTNNNGARLIVLQALVRTMMMPWWCIQEWNCSSDEVRNGGAAVINLHRRFIDDVQAERIAEALMDPNTVVQMIELSNNFIRDKGATAIGKALQTNSKLQQLCLGRNRFIASNGAKAIAEALTKNSTLRGLFLEGNKIGDEGAKAIAKSLTENSTLQLLDLSDNSIGDDGAVAIAHAVTNNSTLQELLLFKNDISSGVITSINTSLCEDFREKPRRDTENENQECCFLCGLQTTVGLSCSDHFICAPHLRSHKGIASGESPLKCLMEGCTKCYQKVDAQSWLPASMYRYYVLNCMEAKIDVTLDGIQDLRRASDRALLACGVPRHW